MRRRPGSRRRVAGRPSVLLPTLPAKTPDQTQPRPHQLRCTTTPRGQTVRLDRIRTPPAARSSATPSNTTPPRAAIQVVRRVACRKPSSNQPTTMPPPPPNSSSSLPLAAAPMSNPSAPSSSSSSSLPPNPLAAASSFLHHHLSRLASRFAAPPRPALAAVTASAAPPGPQGASASLSLALAPDEVARALTGTPVFTVCNSSNEFVLVSDPATGLRSLGLLCFRSEDADALLTHVRMRQPVVGRGAKVVPITLDQDQLCIGRVMEHLAALA
uniref:Uncharacterized protein n=1 Tax=Oryza glumipatula TaxID=40148 RepID=A0A0E0A6K5_9ORYZ